jgi:hypothetical protein
MTSVERAEEHRELMEAAIEHDAVGQRALLAGDGEAARAAFAAGAEGPRRGRSCSVAAGDRA